MSAVDPFGRTDTLEESALRALVTRFEARGASPVFSGMLEDYLDAMHIDDAATVLDMGSGTGVASRAIARRGGFSGTVLGVDLSSYLVAAAQRLAREEGVAEALEFRVGNVYAVDAPDRAFDAVVAHTLLSHVEAPAAVLREAARVLRPGGMLGVFDGDYASMTFGNANPVQGKVYDEAVIAALVTNPRVMRLMPRLLREAGFELIMCSPYVLAETGRAQFWASAIEAYRHLIPKAGTLTQGEADAWASALRRDSEEGVFFGSSNYYAYVATRP